MDFVFCSDRRVLAGLHVAAKSVLEHLSRQVLRPVFWIFSDDIDVMDLALLQATLESTGRSFTLHLRSVNAGLCHSFPRLSGSLATYYRLLVPEQIDADRYLYLDVDTLCRADLLAILEHELVGHPVALCAEGPMASCADKSVVEFLGTAAIGNYFNAGVMLVDRNSWRQKEITTRCLDHLAKHRADYWDQSALNCVLHGDIAALGARFNCFTNVRANWPALKVSVGGKGRLLHFTDYPKPWSRHGKWVHPFGREWWNAYRNTAHYRVGPRPDLEVKLSAKQWPGYKKAIKDQALFSAYSLGWICPKGVPYPGEAASERVHL
jgi:lipopolysaccharide biosynthesis glycosyltransferase